MPDRKGSGRWTGRIAKLPDLRAAAGEKGLEVEKAIAKDRWRLRKPDGSYVLTPSGSAAWRIDAALRYLRTLTGDRYGPGQSPGRGPSR